MSLIVTGSIGIDSIEAPTGTAENVLGGSAIYFAAAASFFGPVRLVAAVGEDFPEPHLDTFRHFQVNLDGLERRGGSKTFRWHGRYHQDMNQRDTIEVQLNVLAEDLPAVPTHYCDSRFVFLANTHPRAQATLLENFPNRALAIADTMDLWIETERPALLDLLRKVDGIVLNDSEAYQLTDKTNIVHAARDILTLGPRFVVIKKGEHGSFLMHANGMAALPAYATGSVVDPTGAGDTFAGAMMGYLASAAAGGDHSLPTLKKAMAYGTVVASFTIESFSLDRLKKLSRADLDKRMLEYCAMLQVSP